LGTFFPVPYWAREFFFAALAFAQIPIFFFMVPDFFPLWTSERSERREEKRERERERERLNGLESARY
jgi:hypothetical protein